MNILEAFSILQLRKGQIMTLAYGKDYAGIDSALNVNDPENADRDNYLHCTDCRKFPYRVRYIPDDIPDTVKLALIFKATLYSELLCESYDIEVSTFYPVIQELDKIIVL